MSQNEVEIQNLSTQSLYTAFDLQIIMGQYILGSKKSEHF